MFLIFLLLVSSSCTVKSESLVGTWVISAESRQKLPEMQSVAGELTLNQGGSFNVSAMPLVLFSESPEPTTGSGAWKLESRNGEQEVQLNLSIINGRQLGFGTPLKIGGMRSFTLYYYVGDPDLENRIYFEKKK